MKKAEKQIAEYQKKLENATSKKEKQKIKKKMQNVIEDAKDKAKGENHGKRGKGKR